ncbi:MAG TPA: DNA-processing protein DprA, partial [Candidatus Eisenbacteria bacterium]|nr:DNA-processing protein DprA [Candidatus Eisenbacteria bacterium]
MRLAARPRGIEGIPSRDTERDIERAARHLERSGGRAVPVHDRACPAGLSSLAGGPRVVFLAGPWSHPGPLVAVVGARDASDDGCDVAFGLARSLAEQGVAVVSGLARGIDAAAHRGALEAGGKSGAVLGTGLERVYPKEHGALQRALAGSLGLLSALLPGSHPTRNTFASRNRILAAISAAVVVVQGRERSGALLTATAARQLCRPLGAMPWDSRDPLGAAPHALIRAG